MGNAQKEANNKLVEADIKRCVDNINHEVLIEG